MALGLRNIDLRAVAVFDRNNGHSVFGRILTPYGKRIPRPIEDEANLERCRAKAGMITMKAYREHMEGDVHDHYRRHASSGKHQCIRLLFELCRRG